MKFGLFYAITFLLATNSKAQPVGSDNYKIYDVKARQVITVKQFVESLGSFDVLFFGENHSDAVAHYLEDSLYRMLCHKYSTVALSMEAFSTDCQVVLDEFIEGFISEEKFKSNAYVWEPFYRGYAKLLNSARQNKLPVIAANAPVRYVELVSERGMSTLDSLGEASKKFLPPLPFDITHDKYYDDYKEVMQGTVTFNDSLWQSFALNNAAMSYNIYKFWLAHKDYRIISVNGAFHSDERLGVVAQLLRLNSSISVKTISCIKSDTFNNPDWSSVSSLADFIIITDPTVKSSFLP